MLDIYICEDESFFREYLQDTLEKDINFTDKEMQIVLNTPSPNELLTRLKNNNKKNLYFLDIYLYTDIDGIQLASKIRKLDPTGYIVFVTSDGDSYKKTFEHHIQAFDYVEKSLDDTMKRRLGKILDAVNKVSTKQNEPNENVYSFKSVGQTRYVNKDDVAYIEVIKEKNKKLRLVTENAEYTINGTLNALEQIFVKQTNSNFVRISQSVLLNLRYVSSINRNHDIVLQGGIIKRASRRHIVEIKRAFANYQKR